MQIYSVVIRKVFTLWLLTSATVALAGGHTSQPPDTSGMQLDPELRSDITGLGLATAILAGWTVIATARNPKKADELNALARENDNVTVEYLDLLDHEGIDKLAKQLSDTPIDVLLNNAAVLGDPSDQDFGSYNYETMEQIYAVNVVGTIKVAEAFYDSVVASEQKKIVAITSQQGSITELRDPLIPFYKMSKTALNMGMRSISRRTKKQKVTIALISPGAVDTQMMNSALDYAGFKGAGFLITPEESAEAVINIIDQYDLKMTGTFMSHRGTVIPW